MREQAHSRWHLIADIGGTNARLARSFSPGTYADMITFEVAGHATFEDVLASYIARFDIHDCQSARIAAAGPLQNGAIKLTNAPWVIRDSSVASALGGRPVSLCNDLEAVARLLPHLSAGDVAPMAAMEQARAQAQAQTQAQAQAYGPRLAINIGTGFGAAFALPGADGAWWFGSTEAGHMQLPRLLPADEAMVPGAQCIEDVLSGQGISRLAARLAECEGSKDFASGNPFGGDDAQMRRTLMMVVSRLIGEVAGDLALATGAWGGVYFCGSVAQAWHAALAQVDGAAGLFHSHFVAKGKMRGRMVHVPTVLITTPEPGLAGLSHGADQTSRP